METNLVEKPKEASPDTVKNDRADMPFIEHLEVLRWHVIRALIAYMIFVVIAFIFMKSFFYPVVLLGPSKPDFPTYIFLCNLAEKWNTPALCLGNFNLNLQNITVSGQFMTHISSSFVIGFILAFPYIFLELWRFVKPGLSEKEIGAGRFLVFWVSLLFGIGLLFSYFIITPYSIQFFATYQLDPNIANIFTLDNYINLVTTINIGTGIIFLLPLVIYFLSRLGIVTPKMLKDYRKQAYVVILVISAMITPPDVISQLLVSLPIFLLYEISISVASRNIRKYYKENASSALYDDE